MGFLKSLFGGKDETPEEKKAREAERNFDMLKTDGVRALRTGRHDIAVKCLTKALEIQDELETHDYLSQAYMQAENFSAALEQLAILAEAQPDNIRILATMAKVAYMTEDYTKMRAFCEKAMLIDKDDPEVMFLYARAAAGHNDMVNAIAMYTKTIMLDGDFAAAYLERGQLLLRMGDIDGADDDANYLLEVAPGAEDVTLLKANVLMRRNQYADAIKFFDQTIEAHPYSTEAYKGRGAARLALGDKEGAESDMRQVLDIDPHALDGVSGDFTLS